MAWCRPLISVSRALAIEVEGKHHAKHGDGNTVHDQYGPTVDDDWILG